MDFRPQGDRYTEKRRWVTAQVPAKEALRALDHRPKTISSPFPVPWGTGFWKAAPLPPLPAEPKWWNWPSLGGLPRTAPPRDARGCGHPGVVLGQRTWRWDGKRETQKRAPTPGN